MAIDPGDVVVDGVDDVSAEDHNKQRTALLALEAGAINGIRGNAVDAGTPNFGQAYVWDGDSFNPTSVTQQVISDAGQQAIGTNNSKTSMFAGTKPVIAANTLAVGDQFQIVGAGAFETVGGAASTLKIDWDLINPTPTTVNIATITSASVGVTKLVNVRFQIDALVTAIGASATIMITMTLSVSANSVTLVDVLINHVSSTGPATVNSTVALTHDLSLTCSANNANNTWSTILLNGTYTPKFAEPMAKYGAFKYGAEKYGMSQPTNTGTGTANNAVPSVAAAAGNAAGTGTANNATAPTTISVSAGNAAGTGTSYSASSTSSASIGNAAGTGTASDAAAKLNISTGLAAAAGTAFDAAPTTDTVTNINAGNAAGTGTANNPSSSTLNPVGIAAGTGIAQNATADITQPFGDAQFAAANGIAWNATVDIGTFDDLDKFVAIFSSISGNPRFYDVNTGV